LSKPVQGLDRLRRDSEPPDALSDDGAGAGNRERAAREWDEFVADFIRQHFAARPHLGVDAGLHEYDGRLPDWRPSGHEAQLDRLRTARIAAEAFDLERLDDRRRYEREYLISVVNGQLFWLGTARWHEISPGYYSRALDPTVYITREYAPADVRMAAFSAYARRIPAALRQMADNLRSPMPSSYAALGRTAIGGLAEYLETDAIAAFRGVGTERAQMDFEDARRAAVAAFRSADAWFGDMEAKGTDSYALGRDMFEEMLLATEMVDVSVEQLSELARADLERNRAALAEAARQLAPDLSVAQAVALVQSRKPPDGPVAAARRQLERLREFVAEHGLVSIPPGEDAIVRETPPFHRWNAGMIDIPGPFETGLPAIYYITPPDPDWTPEEQARYIPGEADLLFMSLHEVWPGHFLHFQTASRQPSKFGRIFTGYAFTEGWAHYAEEMVCEAGLCGGDAETRIGQLLNALIRNVRFVVTLGLHTADMTIDEAELLFREQAFMDPMNARQQAARGTFDPGYLSYTLGKLMIRTLRDDWMAARGGGESLREFHDSLLALGAPPIPIARRQLLGSDSGPPI
jgi:hypothetical protein